MIQSVGRLMISRRKASGGWALLESAVSVGLFAAILFILTGIVQRAGKEIDESSTIPAVYKGDIALLGFFLVNKRLPVPDQIKFNSARPGYIEGWLPLAELGLSSASGRVRYLVHESLTRAPAIYNADPENITTGGVGLRNEESIADTCANLFALEKRGAGLPGGLRPAYVLQQVIDTAGQVSPTEDIWLGDTVSSAIPPADLSFTTSKLGFNELAGEAGCYIYMPRLSASVRGAGVAIDLERLAKFNVDLIELEVRILQRKLDDLKWRLANWSVILATYIARFGVHIATGVLDPRWSNPGHIIYNITLTFLFGGTMAGVTSVVVLTALEIGPATENLRKKKLALDDARTRLVFRTSAAARMKKNANILQGAKDAI